MNLVFAFALLCSRLLTCSQSESISCGSVGGGTGSTVSLLTSMVPGEIESKNSGHEFSEDVLCRLKVSLAILRQSLVVNVSESSKV